MPRVRVDARSHLTIAVTEALSWQHRSSAPSRAHSLQSSSAVSPSHVHVCRRARLHLAAPALCRSAPAPAPANLHVRAHKPYAVPWPRPCLPLPQLPCSLPSRSLAPTRALVARRPAPATPTPRPAVSRRPRLPDSPCSLRSPALAAAGPAAAAATAAGAGPQRPRAPFPPGSARRGARRVLLPAPGSPPHLALGLWQTGPTPWR
nr:predicted GPI-anchored protein 58 [Aegilops tauschii subsp. strangulata]